jgi:hypothetical protein
MSVAVLRRLRSVAAPNTRDAAAVRFETPSNTVHDIQEQVVDARVWLGFHFRNSVEQGEKLGNDVARWELKQYFESVR